MLFLSVIVKLLKIVYQRTKTKLVAKQAVKYVFFSRYEKRKAITRFSRLSCSADQIQ